MYIHCTYIHSDTHTQANKHTHKQTNTHSAADSSQCMCTHVVWVWLYSPQLNSCSLNKFFITSTLFFGVGVSIIAILPWIQRGPCASLDSISISLCPLHVCVCVLCVVCE